MSLASAAEVVLRQNGGTPLPSRDITAAAIEQGLIRPKSATPWVHLQAALSQDIRRREAQGETPRFVRTGPGVFRLNVLPTPPEVAVAGWNAEIKQRLRDQLFELDPSALERLIGDLLERLEFDDIEVTSRSRDGGIDVRGARTLGGLGKVDTAIQVKRTRRNVPIGVVRELRGSLNPSEQGLVISTSGFTRDAMGEACAPERIPISLVDGEMLVDLLAGQGLGMTRRTLVVLEIDEQLMAGLLPESEEMRQTGIAPVQEQPAAGAERFVLFRLPSSGSTRMRSLVLLLSLVQAPTTVQACIDHLMRRFPNITRRDVAIRHLRVLVALGFADIEGDSIFLTPIGRKFSRKQDLEILRAALLRRIYGAEELLSVLRTRSLRRSEVLSALEAAGVTRINETQARQLVDWFLLSSLARRAGRDQISLAPSATP